MFAIICRCGAYKIHDYVKGQGHSYRSKEIFTLSVVYNFTNYCYIFMILGQYNHFNLRMATIRKIGIRIFAQASERIFKYSVNKLPNVNIAMSTFYLLIFDVIP